MKSERNVEVRRVPEQERSKDTVNVILEAAKTLFGELGIDVVSMTQIANQAGMSKPALYRYFPNKQSIVRELADRDFDENRAFIQAALQKPHSTIRDLLVSAITEYCQLHLTAPYKIQLRAAIQADPLLAKMDLSDTRNNVALIAEIMIKIKPDLVNKDLEKRLLLFTELTDGFVRLISKVDEAEATKLIGEFIDVFTHDLLND